MLSLAEHTTLNNTQLRLRSNIKLRRLPHTTQSRRDSAQMTKQDNLAHGDNSPNDQPSTKAATKRNAFAELMSPKSSKALKPSSASTSIAAPTSAMTSTSTEKASQHHRTPRDPRSGLLSYIEHPNTYPANTVLRVTDDTVLIRDLYPKATVHLLLLPRSPQHYNLHPHEAFNDPNFLALMKREAKSATDLAASELSRLISPHSAACRARNEAMDAPDPPPSLPPGRDFHRDLRVGIHAHPSMNHLHVHIISRDMHSPALKHRKHYNSFNTDFFIPLADYPLSPDDQRRSVPYQNANLSRDFVCWRCGKGFGNKFAKLKDHLDQEYMEWKTE